MKKRHVQSLISLAQRTLRYLGKGRREDADYLAHSGNEIIIHKCRICGRKIMPLPFMEVIDNLRETIVCNYCKASKRNIDLCFCILKTFNLPQHSLLESLDKLRDLHVYEIACSGAIHNVLSALPSFVCSEYFDDVRPGDLHKSGIRCEDIQMLSFKKNTFDLVISQDVLEHVSDPIQGLKEIYSVLKPGGYHIFTIPFHKNSTKSIRRAILEKGEIKHLLSPVYHGDPIRAEGALVFTDFGNDLIDSLREVGFGVELYEVNYPQYKGGYNVVFITVKEELH